MTTRRRWLWAFPAVLLAIATLVAVCEWRGWPFLERPAERWLSQRLDREVDFQDAADDTNGGPGRRFHLRMIGPLRFEAAGLRIANPDWSQQQPMLQAHDAQLRLRWRDVFALRRGEPLRIESLVADRLHLQLQRLPDGRSSWQFGNPNPKADEPGRSGFEGLRFGRLAVREGRVLMDDRPMQLAFDARLSLEESSLPAQPGAATSARADRSATTAKADTPDKPDKAATAAKANTSATSPASAPRASSTPPAATSATAATAAIPQATGIAGRAEGRFRGHPMTATLRTGPALAGLTADIEAAAVPMRLKVEAGPARLHFDGQVSDLFGSQRFEGRYEVSGPSLAAIGDALGLTLPTTKPFSMLGRIRREGTHWETVVQRAQVGRSRLAGEFSFDAPRGTKPRLTGRLTGPLLYLDDLGPAIGVESKPRAAAARPKQPRPPGAKVLPDRKFDLPSLSAMNADVSVALDRLDPGSERLQPMSPLRGRVRLDDGVLRIDDILARWAQGQVKGSMMVDGRQPVARWEAHLAGSGLLLEQWLKLERPAGQAPYVTGLLGARVDITGQGRSTAEFLASADGRALLHWTRGTISHLVVEAAGIDVAQVLGVLVRGDQPLAVTCGAADLRLKDGRVVPQVLLVDTSDSTLWADGSLSLADEKLALVARVEPKDFSPLALRSPLHVDGTLGAPKVSIEKAPLVKRVGSAALLAMLHPLAAILPLMDSGDDDAKAAIGACRSVAERAKKVLPPAPRNKAGVRGSGNAPATPAKPLPPPALDASPAPRASAPRRG
jgi:uncharacterized protein involved in outer membrane biogenesis